MSDRQLTLNKAIPANSLLKIYRETTTDTIVSWNDASVLRAKDMSLQEVQLLHLAEETADKVFDTGMSTSPTNTNVWDGQYKRITNLLDPQEDGDAVTLRYVNDKQHGLLNALKNEGANQNASIVAAGNTQNSRLNTTGDTQNKRLTATGEAQNSRLTTTGDSYVETMTSLKADATTQASSATTKATEAKNSATSASSSASTATTKATEASNSAELAKKWAMSDSSPDGVSGNKSSKTWANEAKASETRASSYAHRAEIASDNAEDSATAATSSATAAASSATAAAKSAQDAAKFDPSSYYTKAQTYTKTEVDNKIATDGMPTGTVLAFAGNTVPNNYLLCDGSAVSRSTYANLFKVIGTTYGAGNGSTTFNLPNLVDRFVEGGSASGAVKSAGLPNITGRISTGGGYGFDGIWSSENRGAFNINTDSHMGWSAVTKEIPVSAKSDHALFDASLSNPIYGKSTTVQPPALTMQYIIKY